MDSGEVLRLAKLARIEISPEEAESLSHEFDAILGYVSDIRSAVGETEAAMPKSEDVVLKNIMREDASPHESGIYTEKLLAEAPLREGDYIKVKKIL